jgi:hypothetical protein
MNINVHLNLFSFLCVVARNLDIHTCTFTFPVMVLLFYMYFSAIVQFSNHKQHDVYFVCGKFSALAATPNRRNNQESCMAKSGPLCMRCNCRW